MGKVAPIRVEVLLKSKEEIDRPLRSKVKLITVYYMDVFSLMHINLVIIKQTV